VLADRSVVTVFEGLVCCDRGTSIDEDAPEEELEVDVVLMREGIIVSELDVGDEVGVEIEVEVEGEGDAVLMRSHNCSNHYRRAAYLWWVKLAKPAAPGNRC
jgi:hypothetical protein